MMFVSLIIGHQFGLWRCTSDPGPVAMWAELVCDHCPMFPMLAPRLPVPIQSRV